MKIFHVRKRFALWRWPSKGMTTPGHGHKLHNQVTTVLLLPVTKDIFRTSASNQGLDTSHPLIHQVWRVKGPERDAAHSSPSMSMSRMPGALLPLPPRHVLNHRHKSDFAVMTSCECMAEHDGDRQDCSLPRCDALNCSTWLLTSRRKHLAPFSG
jgi:hypothetical protein